MTPAQALCTATVNPARMMKKQNMGSIKVGNVADLVLLNANPLIDIGNTRKITSVVQRGRVYTHRDIEAIQARARAYFKKN